MGLSVAGGGSGMPFREPLNLAQRYVVRLQGGYLRGGRKIRPKQLPVSVACGDWREAARKAPKRARGGARRCELATRGLMKVSRIT